LVGAGAVCPDEATGVELCGNALLFGAVVVFAIGVLTEAAGEAFAFVAGFAEIVAGAIVGVATEIVLVGEDVTPELLLVGWVFGVRELLWLACSGVVLVATVLVAGCRGGTVEVTGCVASVGARAGELVKGLLTGAELAITGCCTIFGVGTLLLGAAITDVVTAGVGAGIAAGVN